MSPSGQAVSPAWSKIPFALLAAGTLVVPLIVARWRVDPWVLPRLGALWVLLGACAIAIAVGAVLGSERGVRIRLIPSLDIPLAAFAIVNVAATVASADSSQSLIGERAQYQGLLTTLLYVSFFFMARLCVTTLRRTTWLFMAASAGIALVAIYAIAQEIGVDPVWGDRLPSGRAFATIGHSNALAAYLVMGVPIAALLARRSRGIWSGLALVVLAVEIVAVFYTRSRGGYLALLVSLVLIGLLPALRPRPGPRVRRVLVVGACAGLVLAVASGPGRSAVSDSWSRLTAGEDIGGPSSISQHRDIWSVGAHIAVENPLLGTGPATFPEEFPAASREVLPDERVAFFDNFRVESPHNLYLAIGAGAGLIALGTFLWFVVAVVVTLISAGSSRPRAAPVLHTVLVVGAGFAVTNFFITADLASSWLMWLLAGAAVGVAAETKAVSAETLSAD